MALLAERRRMGCDWPPEAASPQTEQTIPLLPGLHNLTQITNASCRRKKSAANLLVFAVSAMLKYGNLTA